MSRQRSIGREGSRLCRCRQAATGRDLAVRPRETPTTGVAVLSGAPVPAASARRSPPAEAEIGTAPPEVGGAALRLRGNRDAARARPDLSRQRRCLRRAPGVSPRGRERRCPGRAGARRNLRSAGSQEPRRRRRRCRSGPGARLVSKGSGTRVAGCAAAARSTGTIGTLTRAAASRIFPHEPMR